MKIIDGKKLAGEILKSLKERVQILPSTPKLAVVQIGYDQATEIYVKHKIQDAKIIGMDAEALVYDTSSMEDLLKITTELNNREDVSGYIIQLPVPIKGSIKKVFQNIKVEKDIDGLTISSLGSIWQNENNIGYVPATVRAVMECIKYVSVYADGEYTIDELNKDNVEIKLNEYLKGKNVVIINESIIVGRPLAALMINRNATVSICHKYTKDLESLTKNADIIISATGVPNLIKSSMTKNDAVIIDVGIKRMGDSIVGDVDFKSFEHTDCWVTPVPGGVGPLTRAMLLDNVLIASKDASI